MVDLKIWFYLLEIRVHKTRSHWHARISLQLIRLGWLILLRCSRRYIFVSLVNAMGANFTRNRHTDCNGEVCLVLILALRNLWLLSWGRRFSGLLDKQTACRSWGSGWSRRGRVWRGWTPEWRQNMYIGHESLQFHHVNGYLSDSHKTDVVYLSIMKQMNGIEARVVYVAR